ncbi:hypothetical protein [Qipengyuania sp. JC766]|uniref:hypothetical protein n=1 Tax=Qipengyuania sp. JC766 TaxID=3232139 RepID=UPI00345794E4
MNTSYLKRGRRTRAGFAIASSIAILACTFAATSPAMAQDNSVQSTTAQTEEPDLTVGAAPDSAVPAGAVGGMGDINLYPRRIIVNQRQRIATVGLYNRVPAAGEYEIGIRDMVMTNDGGLVPLDDPRAAETVDRMKGAGDMLRWSPRRVRLLGNESQTVRVMARPAADLPDGEYRSHFTVISVPEEDGGYSIEDAVGETSEATGIGVVIRPRFAISIPVIVRVGDTTLDVGMEAPTMVDTEFGKAVSLVLTRSGTRSAYGDLIVTAAGRDEPVAVARGIGIYPEVDSRRVEIVLRAEPEQAPLAPGTRLTATFVDDDMNPGETLASREFVVP